MMCAFTYCNSSKDVFDNHLYTIVTGSYTIRVPSHMTCSIVDIQPLWCSTLRGLIVCSVAKVIDEGVAVTMESRVVEWL